MRTSSPLRCPMDTNAPLPEKIDSQSAEPSYQQLAKLLAQQIVRRDLEPGARLPQERDLAGQHQVSRFTVRNALDVLESQGLIQRVRGKGTFVTTAQADGRWFSTASTILLVQIGPKYMPNVGAEGYYGHIHAGVRQMARTLGLGLKVESIAGYVKVPLASYKPPRPSEVGGVILCGTFDDQYIRMFQSEGVPAVVVDYYTHDLNTDCVAIDMEAEAYVAVDHLLERGHTSLGFVAAGRMESGTDLREFDPDVWRLLDNLRRVAQRRRLAMRDEWVVLAASSRQLAPSVRELLSLRSRPTAVFCFDNGPAAACLQMISEGLARCPEDISLISRACEFDADPQVTSFISDPELMGRMAVKLLMERMSGQRQRAAKLAVAGRFARGTTTGPAPHL